MKKRESAFKAGLRKRSLSDEAQLYPESVPIASWFCAWQGVPLSVQNSE